MGDQAQGRALVRIQRAVPGQLLVKILQGGGGQDPDMALEPLERLRARRLWLAGSVFRRDGFEFGTHALKLSDFSSAMPMPRRVIKKLLPRSGNSVAGQEPIWHTCRPVGA